MEEQPRRKSILLADMRTIIIGAALLLLFFAAGARFGDFLRGQDEAVAAETAAWYQVDVKGAVEQPGIYRVEAGSRVAQLLEQVELAEGAAPELLNQAAFISDGSELIVPFAAGEVDWNALARERGGSYYGQSAAGDSAAAITGRVNINTAGEAELQTLSGIGPAKAKAIVEHRAKYGAFVTKEQLMNVTGIGQKTYDKLKDNISID